MPTHIKINRDGLGPGEDPAGFVETEDFVELDGAPPDKIACMAGLCSIWSICAVCVGDTAVRSGGEGASTHVAIRPGSTSTAL